MSIRGLLFGIFIFGVSGEAFTQNTKKPSEGNLSKIALNNVEKEDLREEMDRFLGFGFHVSVSRDENNADTQNREWKLSDGFKLKLGIKLPKYLKTKPPEKIIAMDYNIYPLKK